MSCLANRDNVETEVVPEKSPRDTKTYRFIKLGNGLRALLISSLVHDTATDASKSETGKMDVDETDLPKSVLVPSCIPQPKSIPTLKGIPTPKCIPKTKFIPAPQKKKNTSMARHQSHQSRSRSEHGCSTFKKNQGKSHSTKSAHDCKSPVIVSSAMAAASLVVGAGSFSDRADFPGVAHLLEHTITMGCTKYPQTSSYPAFITTHGGFSNAATYCERQSYHFCIEVSALEECLERFAQNFTSPQFLESTIENELNNVNSEYEEKKVKENCQFQQLLTTMATPDSCFALFNYGCKKSLKVGFVPMDKLRRLLIQFYKDYYLAQNMTLCVQGGVELDTLEKWVRKSFSDIPCNETRRRNFCTGKAPFAPERFYKMYHVVPITQVNQLQITWCLPPVQAHYKGKPLEYIRHLLRREGRGSLALYLRRQNWIHELVCPQMAVDYFDNQVLCIFQIRIGLFDLGLQHVEEVLTAVFTYLKFLQRTGPQEYIFEELKQERARAFEFYEEPDAFSNVEHIASAMFRLPIQHVLKGDELYFEYQPTVISSYLNNLNPSTANFMIKSLIYEKSQCLLQERWFDARYEYEDVPSLWHFKWGMIWSYSDFSLPEANPYVPVDFTIYNNEEHNPELSQYSEDDLANPISIPFNLQHFWYKLNNTELLPKTSMWFYFQSPYPLQSADGCALAELWMELLDFKLEEVIPTEVIGIGTSRLGMELSLHCYNDAALKILSTIMEHIRDVDNLTNETLFQSLKKDQKKRFFNDFIQPVGLAKDLLRKITRRYHWSKLDLFHCLDQLTYCDMIHYIKGMFNHVHMVSLIFGNTTTSQATAAFKMVIDTMGYRDISHCVQEQIKILDLPIGTSLLRVENFNPLDKNTICLNYFQTGRSSTRTNCLTFILTHLMEQPAFNRLRTEKLLGYVVQLKHQRSEDMVSIQLEVHTSSYTPETVQTQIDEFLVWYGDQRLNILTNEDLQACIKTLVEDREYESSGIDCWKEILREEYNFKRCEEEMNFLRKITLGDVKEFYTRHLHPKSSHRQKLVIQVVSQIPIIPVTEEKQKDAKETARTETAPPCDDNSYKLRYKHVEDVCSTCITDIDDFKQKFMH